MTSSSSSREDRDRQLFDTIAQRYERKDRHPTARIARAHRLHRTLAILPLEGGRILPRMAEIGCGAGYAAEYLEGSYSHLSGIDHSSELISLAQDRHGERTNVDFIAADVLAWQPMQKFDVVFAVGVLHHLTELSRVLVHVHTALRPGGWFVVNEPQPGNPLIHLARRIRKRLDPTYSAEQVELSGSLLRKAFAQAGFDSIAEAPQGYFSPPLAEVPIPLGPLGPAIARMASTTDRFLERTVGRVAPSLSWNVIVAGQRRGES